LAVGASDCARPASPATARRNREARLRPIHARLCPHRDDVLELQLGETGTKRCVVSVDRVGQDWRRRQLPAGRPLAEIAGQLRLRLEANRLRDLRLPPTLSVLAPLLRQVEAPAERHRPPPSHRQTRILALPPHRQRPRHPLDELDHALAHLDRRPPYRECRPHPLLLRTMPADADTIRREQRGPFNQLTKSY